ncbi:MAG: type II toxin-antitoxin system Phd/YefM family antitoxin [Candidatus Xenobia bacterium]
MKTVTIHQAKTHLSRIIQEVLQGEEVVIARGKVPLVRLVVHESARPQRKFGALPDLVVRMTEDFDEPLEDFQEYMQ